MSNGLGIGNRVPCGASSLGRRRSFGAFAAVCAVAAVAIGFGLALTHPARSQSPGAIHEVVAGTRHAVVTLYKSRTFDIGKPFAKAVVGSPDIADVLPMSDRVLYVQGKKVGTTNVSVFDANMHLINVIDIEVAVDTENLANKIRSGTDSRGIRVSSDAGQVVLSGEARDAVSADRAIAIAKGLADKIPVVNAMRVAASQQVMLKVRFLEATRDAGRDLGVNWFYAQNGTRGINTGLGGVTQSTLLPPPSGISVFNAVTTFAGTSTGQPFGVALANLVNKNGTTVDLLVTALEKKGLVRRLAEPDLVALSGDTASFLAGGEYPVPTVQPGSGGGLPIITTDYKPYGVQLQFNPTVLANGIINLRLAPSVSELDYANAVVNQGYLIPALIKREARTTIELRDGQSFAIAGLLSTEGTRNMSQVPWIGSVPVLGALFRSTSFQQKETDLVVIVTPHLVAPGVPGQRIATPFDERLPGNDLDLFLLGQGERTKTYTDVTVAGGKLQGPYGHIVTLDQQ